MKFKYHETLIPILVECSVSIQTEILSKSG